MNWLTCKKCGLHKTRRNVVLGRGEPNAPIWFIGEGPGQAEDFKASAFVGPAGKLLDEGIKAAFRIMGVQPIPVYFTNLVACRPTDGAGNRQPTLEEVAACEPRLRGDIMKHSPFIIACGKVPQKHLSGKFKFFPILHPAYLLRYGGKNAVAWMGWVRSIIEAFRASGTCPEGPDPNRIRISATGFGGWKECRQKAAYHYAGWHGTGSSQALIFGTIIHKCLEVVYRSWNLFKGSTLSAQEIRERVLRIINGKVLDHVWRDYPNLDREQACVIYYAQALVPAYFALWGTRDFEEITPEHCFEVPYKDDFLITGRIDGKCLKAGEHWVLETKTMSRIVQQQILTLAEISFQNRLYHWVSQKEDGISYAGVLYNIIRTPQLKPRKKNENAQQFYQRLEDDIRSRPEFYFIRIPIRFSWSEVNSFENSLKGQFAEFKLWWEHKALTYRSDKGNVCFSRFPCEYVDVCSRTAIPIENSGFYTQGKERRALCP